MMAHIVTFSPHSQSASIKMTVARIVVIWLNSLSALYENRFITTGARKVGIVLRNVYRMVSRLNSSPSRRRV